MAEPVALGPKDAPALAAFSRVALPFDLLSTTSLRRSVFSDPDPQTVLGVVNGGLEGMAVGVVRGTHGWVKLLAVHPAARRRGIGAALLARIEDFCRDAGALAIDVGTSAPYYLVPGVDARCTEAVLLFEDAGYTRSGEAVNLTASLRDLDDPPLPVRAATPRDLEALGPWVDEHFPHWRNEVQRAVALGTCIVHRDLGFACYDVNREGWFGPIATRPDAGVAGVGTATLLGALHALRDRGHERVEIAWATALPFYAKTVGARVGRVFWWYRKTLSAGREDATV